MLPVSESEHARLLSGCYLFVTNANTHTGAHTARSFGALSLPHYYSRVSHTHTRTHTFAFPLPALTRCFFSLTHTFCRFLGSAAVICCCHLTCHPNPPTPTHTHAAIVCFISPFALLTSLVFYCRKLLLHSCVFIICSDRKGPLSVCVCVCVLPSVAFSRDSSHTHYAALFVALSNCYLFHAHAHTHMQKACMTAASLHTHTFSHSFFCSYGAHTFVVWVLYEIVRGCVCVCVWERVRACQVVRE